MDNLYELPHPIFWKNITHLLLAEYAQGKLKVNIAIIEQSKMTYGPCQEICVFEAYGESKATNQPAKLYLTVKAQIRQCG